MVVYQIWGSSLEFKLGIPYCIASDSGSAHVFSMFSIYTGLYTLGGVNYNFIETALKSLLLFFKSPLCFHDMIALSTGL